MEVIVQVSTDVTIPVTTKKGKVAVREIRKTGRSVKYGEILEKYHELRERKREDTLNADMAESLNEISDYLHDTFKTDVQAVIITWHHREIPDGLNSFKHEELL